VIGRTLGILIMLTALLAASQSVSSENITSENNKSGNVILGPPTIFNDTMNIKIAGNEKILNCSGTIPKASPAPMSDSDILATHNAYRIAVGEDPLVWSTELASYAQDWANYLVANNLFEHSYGLYGENLAAGPLTDSQLVDLWGAEKQYFKCGTFPDVSTTGNWRDVGHYTQMIWPDTEECGCGIASSSTYPYSKVLVCEYNPPGNFIGQYICPSNAYPNKPSIPSGPASGVAGTAYSYSTSATDPDGNQVKYTFDWGDGSNSTTGLFDSGAVASAGHIWNSSGVYEVRAMATNSKGASSGWSDPLNVTINAPPSIPTVTNGIGCSLVTAYSARLNGEIVDTGGENPTVHICWGTADGATTQASWQNDASLGVLGTGAFYKDISGLTPGTKYYYRCYATNSAGTGWAGSTANFTTQAVLIQPVYRMYSPSQTDHFYTTNYYEYSAIAPAVGYIGEGILGYIQPDGLAKEDDLPQVLVNASSNETRYLTSRKAHAHKSSA